MRTYKVTISDYRNLPITQFYIKAKCCLHVADILNMLDKQYRWVYEEID